MKVSSQLSFASDAARVAFQSAANQALPLEVVDPSAGTGVDVPEGLFGRATDGSLWHKNGADATAWIPLLDAGGKVVFEFTAADITDAGIAGKLVLQAETVEEQRELLGVVYPTILLPSGENIFGSIPNNWAYDSNDTELILGNSVTSIGTNAFRNCPFTGNLTIPNSVTSIGSSAFRNCIGFTGSLTIPDSVTSIGSNAFDGCEGFNGSLTIPNSVTTIGSYAFDSCIGFTGSLNIPDSVTTIGSYAFYYCIGFNGSLTIPNSVTTIGNRAFSYCIGFTGSLTIPDSVTSIGSYAFYGCSGLTTVNCRITKAVFDATDGASDMFAGTSADLVLHALPDTGWVVGEDLTIGGNDSVDVVLDLT